jgi:hypothetical protein
VERRLNGWDSLRKSWSRIKPDIVAVSLVVPSVDVCLNSTLHLVAREKPNVKICGSCLFIPQCKFHELSSRSTRAFRRNPKFLGISTTDFPPLSPGLILSFSACAQVFEIATCSPSSRYSTRNEKRIADKRGLSAGSPPRLAGDHGLSNFLPLLSYEQSLCPHGARPPVSWFSAGLVATPTVGATFCRRKTTPKSRRTAMPRNNIPPL